MPDIHFIDEGLPRGNQLLRQVILGERRSLMRVPILSLLTELLFYVVNVGLGWKLCLSLIALDAAEICGLDEIVQKRGRALNKARNTFIVKVRS